MKFAGKAAIVTGASRGIGLAIAQRLVAGGGRVVITARSPEPLEQAVEELGGAECALAVTGRADDPEHRADVVTRALNRFGSIDILVNNAGINPAYGPLLGLDLKAARKIVEVNCLSALAMVQEICVAGKMAQRGGAILNVASIAGLRPAPGIGFYGASKAMLVHLTRELAVELAPSVRVNAVAPGVVKTRFASALYEDNEADKAAGYPLRRLGVPADVAAAAVYLLSDDADWITGETLIVDGGLHLSNAAT